MGKLWEKGYRLDELLEAFTVGDDYKLDRHLVVADCLGSVAHAKMLSEVGLLTSAEAESLVLALRNIGHRAQIGEFVVNREDEDCHTAIESALVTELGDAGKKIHTGRSRNDQVLLALRLYERDFVLAASRELLALVQAFLDLADEHADVPMVGRTHMQPAMPSSVGLWAGAWAEELLADAVLLFNTYELVNRSPLGSAAGYGTSLPLDRERVAELLGLDGLFNNVLWASNSRGKVESIILDALDQGGLTLSKIAADLMLYSLPEFGYFTLPDDLCTGSSIMPQKKNPDGLELLRAKSAVLSAATAQVKNVIRSLPSGYNRDFQETKEPLFRGMAVFLASVALTTRTVGKLGVNADRLTSAFTPEVFATDVAYDMVRQGVPFRDAYRRVAEQLGKIETFDPVAALETRKSTGTPGNLSLETPKRGLEALRSRVSRQTEAGRSRVEQLLGAPLDVFSPLGF